MTGKHVYQILLSLLCILLAVLICSAAVGIYREGSRRKEEHPLETVYTKEAVEDASAHIAPLLIVTAVMAGGGILLRVQDDRKAKPSGRICMHHRRDIQRRYAGRLCESCQYLFGVYRTWLTQHLLQTGDQV